MDLFTIDITEAVGVGVEADGGVQGSFTAGKSEADVGISTTDGCSGGRVLRGKSERRWGGCGECRGVYSTDNLALVVPVSFSGADVCPGHAEAFGGGEGGTGAG